MCVYEFVIKFSSKNFFVLLAHMAHINFLCEAMNNVSDDDFYD